MLFMIELCDTHCHIHFPDYGLDKEGVYEAAIKNDVNRMICVGCSLEDSELGIEFAQSHANAWATIGLHPHEAQRYIGNDAALKKFESLAKKPKVVAIGECGLDYYYNHSPRQAQHQLLLFQLSLAQTYDLPLVFHIREAFDDFWKIFDQFIGLRGVVHSFSAHTTQLDQILSRDLFVSLNGIMTFTNDEQQIAAAKAVPLKKLLVETDAPFLTPVPYRGKIGEPKYVRVTAEFLSNIRGEDMAIFAQTTTANAKQLFNIV